VVNHCTAPAVTLRSRMSRGIATAMKVSLRITTKVATRSRLMTSRLRPEVSAAAGAATLSGDKSPALAELSVKYGSLGADLDSHWFCLAMKLSDSRPSQNRWQSLTAPRLQLQSRASAAA
jgi:hypothetical protein